MGVLCTNIGLVLACLLSGSTNATASPSRYMTKPAGIPILSPVLLCLLAIPIFPFIDLLVYVYACVYIYITYCAEGLALQCFFIIFAYSLAYVKFPGYCVSEPSMSLL